jgi:hypothetical protein
MRFALLVTCVSLTFAQIPVKRVVLYKNGVGYFEHQGPVQGKQDVTVTFSSGQLNDVLKSLTVLDLNGGRITSIGYDASLSSDRKLNEVRLPVGEKGSLTDFLGAMRGARIEVRNGGLPLTGRLVSVERKTRSGSGATLEVDYVSILTDSGELRTAEVSPAFSVRLLENGLANKLGKYLDVLSADRAADERKVLISADGAGARNLFVSYISEVPVWKATYRLVLGPKPLLQGWAIVDNTVGQDWENVSLSLVAGAPQSFVQNLAQPQFARRPVVALAETINRAPQTFESGIVMGQARLAGRVTDGTGGGIPDALVELIDANNAPVRRAGTNTNGEYSFAGLPEGEFRLVISKPGFAMARLDGVTLQAGGTGRRDVALQVGQVSQAVEVSAPLPEMQAQSSTPRRRNSATCSNTRSRNRSPSPGTALPWSPSCRRRSPSKRSPFGINPPAAVRSGRFGSPIRPTSPSTPAPSASWRKKPSPAKAYSNPSARRRSASSLTPPTSASPSPRLSAASASVFPGSWLPMAS